MRKGSKHDRGLPKAAEPYKFKPGQSGNPGGRTPEPIPNALKKMTRQSYRRIIMAVCKGNIDELQKIAKNPKTSALEVAVASCFLKAIQKGDYHTVEQIAARVLGKVPDEIIVKSKNLHANFDGGMLDHVKVKAALDALEAKI